MKLYIPERLLLLGMLPKEGDYAALKELRRGKEILAFTPQESQDYEIVQHEGGRIPWNAEGNSYMADLPLSLWLSTVVQEELRKLNKEKKLTERELSLYEKFIVAYDQV